MTRARHRAPTHFSAFGALLCVCWPLIAQAAGGRAVAAPHPVTVNGDEDLDSRLDAIGKAGAGLAAVDKERKGPEVRREARNEVIVIGSSSVRGMMGRVFVDNLVKLGFVAHRVGKSASGLARLDYHDWISQLAELPINDRTLAVMVYVGINDPQGIWLRPEERDVPGRKWKHWNDPAWSKVYRGRVTELINELCVRGVPEVIMLPPADVKWQSLQTRLVRIRRLQIAGARDGACGRVISTSGDSLFLFDVDEQIRPRRLKDGYHMTSFGAQVVFDRVKPPLLRLLRKRQLIGSPLDNL